ncbi:MAG: 50S ribosomal protein L13 [bacterium]
MKTRAVSSKEIQRERHELDAQGEILGRLATKAARLLMGKDKTSNVPYLDQGDFVKIVNASCVVVTGRKEEQKRYYIPTQRQGKLRFRTYKQQMQRDPKKIIESAVKGMLPKTKLGARMITRLEIKP